MAIKTHEGWRPGQEYAAKTKLEPATPQSAKVSLGKANALSDKECIPRLIKLGGDVESLHRIQITAAQSMKTAGYAGLFSSLSFDVASGIPASENV